MDVGVININYMLSVSNFYAFLSWTFVGIRIVIIRHILYIPLVMQQCKALCMYNKVFTMQFRYCLLIKLCKMLLVCFNIMLHDETIFRLIELRLLEICCIYKNDIYFNVSQRDYRSWKTYSTVQVDDVRPDSFQISVTFALYSICLPSTTWLACIVALVSHNGR